MPKTFFRLTAIALGTLALTQAHATPVTLNASIANNAYLAAGTTSGQFNGAGILPGNYVINSASFSFSFSDDAIDASFLGPKSLQGVVNSGYSQISNYYDGSNYRYEYLRSQTQYTQATRQFEAESAQVNLAGVNVGTGSTSLQTSTQNLPSAYLGRANEGTQGYGGYYQGYRCGNYTCSYWVPGSYSTYYSDVSEQQTIYNNDYTGDFTMAGAITNPTILNSLLTNDFLQFDLNIYGDLRLTSSSLMLDISELQSVPEPGTLALILPALAGVFYARRRRALGAKSQNPT